MPEIKVLPKQVAELIAAGEVVERPASVIKELVENSIDAGATSIVVEIKNGGVTFIRVTDNGCGIAKEFVATAFLRHATSKVKNEKDLEAIMTLGFRGEALAAISSVSRVEMITKTKEDDMGTLYKSEGGDGITVDDAGCPDGTTIIIRDLFFNTPARIKFLKKDVAEGNAVLSILDHIALSRPDIQFRFIRDGKQIFNTPGDGQLMSAIYAVCGRDFASTLMPVQGELSGIKVSGFTCRPSECRPKKNAQFVFLNGRYIRSGTVSAALETAYKNAAMVGRFPAAVLHLEVPYGAVDINVHPAKTEVRFSDERRIFDCVHFAVKNSIAKEDVRPQMNLGSGAYKQRMTAEEYRQTVIPELTKQKEDPLKSYEKLIENVAKRNQPIFNSGDIRENFGQRPLAKAIKPETKPDNKSVGAIEQRPNAFPVVEQATKNVDETEEINYTDLLEKRIKASLEKEEAIVKEAFKTQNTDSKTQPTLSSELQEPAFKYIGEAFATYILVESGDSIFFVDKHAAHERILFNKFKKDLKADPQMLLVPEQVVLKEDYLTVLENIDLINNVGFEVEDFGDNTILVRAVPAPLKDENVADLLYELADNLSKKNTAEIDRLERIYETMSCRAAVKAGNLSSKEELEALANAVLTSKEIMYCPHGRPVAYELKKKEIEKQFGRI